MSNKSALLLSSDSSQDVHLYLKVGSIDWTSDYGEDMMLFPDGEGENYETLEKSPNMFSANLWGYAYKMNIPEEEWETGFDTLTDMPSDAKKMYFTDYEIVVVFDGTESWTFTPQNSFYDGRLYYAESTGLWYVAFHVPTYRLPSTVEFSAKLKGVSDTPHVMIDVTIDTTGLSGGSSTVVSIPYGANLGSFASKFSEWDYSDLNYTHAGKWKISGTDIGIEGHLVTEPITVQPDKYPALPEHGSFTITISPATKYSDLDNREWYWGWRGNSSSRPEEHYGSAVISGDLSNLDLRPSTFGSSCEVSFMIIGADSWYDLSADLELYFAKYVRKETVFTLDPTLQISGHMETTRTLTDKISKFDPVDLWFYNSTRPESPLGVVGLESKTYTITW